MEAKLVVNGVAVELGHNALADLTLLLSGSKKNQSVYRELAKSPSSEVRQNVVEGNSLDNDTARLLIQDSCIDVLREIVENNSAQRIITEDDLNKFISTGDIKLLCMLSEQVDEFALVDTDVICQKLIAQSDPQVRYRLAQNEYAPKVFLEKLTRDDDVEVAEEAKSTLADLKEWENSDDNNED